MFYRLIVATSGVAYQDFVSYLQVEVVENFIAILYLLHELVVTEVAVFG